MGKTRDEVVRVFRTVFEKIRILPFWHISKKLSENTFLLYSITVVTTVIVLIYLLAPWVLRFPYRLDVGDTAPKDIRASTDLIIEDRATVKKNQQKAEAEVPAVYDFDLKAIGDIEERITFAFDEMRQFLSEKKESVAISKKENEFVERLGIDVSQRSLATLRNYTYSKRIEAGIKRSLRSVMEKGITINKALLLNEREKGIVLQMLGEEREGYLKAVDTILDMEGAREEIQRQARALFSMKDESQRAVVIEIASNLIFPNVTFNKSETEARKKVAVSEVRSLFYKVKKGEIIVRKGERVNPEQAAILKGMAKYHERGYLLQTLLGLVLIISILLYIFYRDIKRYSTYLSLDASRLLLLVILLVGTIAVVRFSYFFLEAFVDKFEHVDSSSIPFALPLATGAMLTTFLFDIHIAIVFSFIVSLLAGLMVREEPFFVLFSFVGCIVAAFGVMKCKKRTELLRAGILVGVANLVMAVALNLLYGRLLTYKGLFDSIFALSGGFLVSLIVSGFLPFFESLFKVTTNIKLLELLDLNQPILQELFVKAPGTYHHSLMVSNLAEAAAEVVDVNPLLARVASYYHDIGKLVKPDYFIENQIGTYNRHDDLTPTMSSLILISHVKEGAEMAREHKLPQVIADVILQHHGSRVISFFFQRARENQDPELCIINEENFRYPGPKPRTKMAAIVMLADAVEAASRVLTEPTPGRIAGFVNKIIEDIVKEGQLDGCDITLKDIKLIEKCFTQVLAGIFHQRIDYPGMDFSHYEDEHIGQKQAEKDQAKPSADKKGGPKSPISHRVPT